MAKVLEQEKARALRKLGESIKEIAKKLNVSTWGEGYKSGNGEVGFTNSNSEMILFILRWFREIFGIQNEDFILRVSVNEQHTQRIRIIERFWSEKTGLPLSQFSKSSLIKMRAKKIYTNMENHYGTLRVKVRRGTDLRRRILGGIEGLKDGGE